MARAKRMFVIIDSACQIRKLDRTKVCRHPRTGLAISEATTQAIMNGETHARILHALA